MQTSLHMKPIINLLLITLFSSCASSTLKMQQKQIKNFDIQGHRGCRGLMPENTIAGFIKALELGVTTLEMDISITKDKIAIVSHEPFFNHEISTKPNGDFVTVQEERSLNMYNMTYSEISLYDIGLKLHPRFTQQQKLKAIKPKLSDVFAAVKQWCNLNKKPLPYFNIETKSLPVGDLIYHPLPNQFVTLLVDQIKLANMADNCIIQSFDFRTLKILHQKHPEIKTAALVEENDSTFFAKQLESLGFQPTIYSPHYKLVDSKLVKNCKLLGIKLIPWTVNTKPEMQTLINLGVDGLISDYPNLYFDLKPNKK